MSKANVTMTVRKAGAVASIVDIQGEINLIEREPEKVAATLVDEKAELRVVVIHQDLVPLLRDVIVGEHILAKGVDIVHAASGELEARSTIWTEFSRP